MIGKKLQIARKQAGLSLRELAAKIDNRVTAQAISKYEHDQVTPGSEILIALSDALGVSESFLVRPSKVMLEGVEFRANSFSVERDRARVEAHVVDHLERYLEVEELLRVPSRDWEYHDVAPFPIRELADAEKAAMNMRAHWGLGKNPISTLVEFFEERGIKVMSLDLPAAFSGLSCWVRRKTGEKVPVIVINKNDSGERQRFTLCHELGHMVMDIKGHHLDQEKVAHRFSSAFFMPDELVWDEVGRQRSTITLGELFALKEVFSVSVEAITYRLKDLGVISAKVTSELYREFSRRGWSKPPYVQPHPLPREVPKRFKRLCFRAVSESAISESKAAELLEVSIRELIALLDDHQAMNS